MNRLIIKLNTITENVTSELISKLYTNAKEIKDYEELNEIEDSQVLLLGNLQTPNAYDDEVTYLETKFPNLHINVTGGRYIRFEDPEVLRVLLTTYGDGTGITMSDILAISNIGSLFKGNTTITKFNEFRYFTGITNRIIDWNNGDSFNGCTNLREITIPKNIENMAANNPAFRNCTSLETVIFDADCVISVCPSFSGCISLINISLPNSVTNIPGNGFYGCSSLVQFDTNNVTLILANAFKFCSSLTSIILSNVIHIGSEAFNNCQALTTVTFNTLTLTLIDGISFEGCSNLVINDLNLPNLTSLGGGAFKETKIKQISNLGSITSISNDTFAYCSQLTSVSLPNTVTTIGDSSFRGCSALTNIDLSNITSIDSDAFHGCTSLGLGQTLELNLINLAYYPHCALAGTKYTRLILHSPQLLNTYDNRYSLYLYMNLLLYLDLSDWRPAKSVFDSADYGDCSFYYNNSLVTYIAPITTNYIGTIISDLSYSNFRYLILLSTTPPRLNTTDHNNQPAYWFYNKSGNVHIYVPDSAKQTYLADTDWASIGGYNGSDTIVDRLHGLSELPAGVWTTGLASLYLTPALLATS